MRMSSTMRWRNAGTGGVETSMILLLSVDEADCLDHQHGRAEGSTNHHQRARSAYRASGFVLLAACWCTRASATETISQTAAAVRRSRFRAGLSNPTLRRDPSRGL